jgi:hypothetical protein
LDSEPAAKVAHDHFQRDDLDLADQLFAHVDAADEVVGHADIGQPGHEEFRQAVVQHALALDRGLFLGVEGGGVILEILDQGARLGAFVQDLGLAFVDLLTRGFLICGPYRPTAPVPQGDWPVRGSPSRPERR